MTDQAYSFRPRSRRASAAPVSPIAAMRANIVAAVADPAPAVTSVVAPAPASKARRARRRVAGAVVAAGQVVSATARQMDALRFIAGYQVARGICPSMVEIGQGLGVVKSAAFRLLRLLEVRGLIKRGVRGQHRAIQILHVPAIPRAPDGAALFFIPVERLGDHGGHHD